MQTARQPVGIGLSILNQSHEQLLDTTPARRQCESSSARVYPVWLTLVASDSSGRVRVADSTKALGSREKSVASPSTGPILQQLGCTAGQTAHTTAESAPPATKHTTRPTTTQQPSDRGCSCKRPQPLPPSHPRARAGTVGCRVSNDLASVRPASTCSRAIEALCRRPSSQPNCHTAAR